MTKYDSACMFFSEVNLKGQGQIFITFKFSNREVFIKQKIIQMLYNVDPNKNFDRDLDFFENVPLTKLNSY